MDFSDEDMYRAAAILLANLLRDLAGGCGYDLNNVHAEVVGLDGDGCASVVSLNVGELVDTLVAGSVMHDGKLDS